MVIVNKSKNTIYIEDVDKYIPYQDNKSQEIPVDTLKKSRCLRNAILCGTLEVVEYDETERIEAAIMYMLRKAQNKNACVQTDAPDPVELIKPTGTVEVKIHGLFYDTSGYAKVNRHLARQLVKAGYTVQIDAKRSQNQLDEEEIRDLVALEKTKLSKNHILIDSIIPSFSEMGTGKYKILYTTIESYTLPEQFVESCKAYNECWLTSSWSASILQKYLPDKPIYVITTGTDTDLYCESGPAFDFRPNVKGFVFVSVFAWNYRKGPDVLMRAYFDEFSGSDDVSLIIMSRYQGGRTKYHRDKIRLDIDKYMSDFPNKNIPHVLRLNQQLSEKDMPKLYRAAHCFVLPSRGEGSNLCAPEAAMCGLPVIMTNVSGQQEYLRPDNAYLIEMDYLQEVQPGMFHIHYWDKQKFPALTSPKVHQQLQKAMRSVYSDYNEAKNRNKKMQQLILNKFTWSHTASAASKRLTEIANKLKG